MNQAVSYNARKELTFEVTYLIARFGRRRALFAILKTFWKGKGRPPDSVVSMNNHLRRDIGLPELSEPSRRLWSDRV
ncbi:hypothetical protein [Cognatishimia activa]|uniref:hypothetical protein n=1 Tax=Cognatishimia activa TaxID=1715691 RepID=UPI00222E0AD1|nr:hypothetical protein [Cognatishimia activa]UZD91227.1 hypothetical protein M0D42_01025 [Cognatishimia activa]